MTAADTSRVTPRALRDALMCAMCAAAFLLGLSGWQAAARAQQAPRLMIVLDGSGSMWGRLNGSSRSKLAAIRQELGAALRAKGQNIAVGLTTFGARSGASCSSAETSLNAGPGQFDQLDRLLSAFNPQGRGPVVLGLRTAVDALSATPGPARLLLIHDSPDNCNQNVCSFARDLAKAQPQMAVDVLSLGLKPKDRDGMACLAKATGGRQIHAATMDAAEAGIDTILTALNAARPVAAKRPGTDSPAATATAKVPPRSSGLTLSARLAKTKTAIKHGISWQIKSRSKMVHPVDRTIHRAALDIALPPATYEVILNTELVRMAKQVEVRKDARSAVAFDVAGGIVEVIAPAAPAPAQHAALAANEATVSVVRTAASGGQAAGAVWTGSASAARALVLAPGYYRITVSNGLSQVSRTIDVSAGSSQKIGFETAPAHLTVALAASDAVLAANAEIRVARKDLDQPEKRTIVARSAAPRATFTLAPGPYYVTLRVHDNETTSLVLLAAGEAVTHTPRLSQMALRVSSHIGDGPKLGGAGVRYRIWRAEALVEPIAISRKAQSVFHLAPGKYRIESRVGHQNAVMIREFDVGVGRAGSLQLRHNAGQVLFAAPATARATRQFAYWEVLDPNNRLIWRSFEPTPSATLTAGAYTATMATKDEKFSTKFVVVAGRRDTVTLQKK
ncbi:MAG: hypothetical protein JXQ99_16490 [Hyphomicrobiaceae bacterium]